MNFSPIERSYAIPRAAYDIPRANEERYGETNTRDISADPSSIPRKIIHAAQKPNEFNFRPEENPLLRLDARFLAELQSSCASQDAVTRKDMSQAE